MKRFVLALSFDQAVAKIRVRIDREGAQFTGSLRNADGSATIIDGATCNEVTATLVAAVAVVVDQKSKVTDEKPTVAAPAAQPAPAPVAANPKVVDVTFASVDGRRVDIALNSGSGIGGGGFAVFYENVCTTPCTAKLARGRSTLQFSDPDAGAYGSGNYVIDAPTTLTIQKRSRSSTRYGMLATGSR